MRTTTNQQSPAGLRINPRKRSRQGRFRIIGGEWRGRTLTFPAEPQVRPSPQRIRETVFNWLQPVIEGAKCLDLFAGSGALGLEALSRQAAYCMFVDRSAVVGQRLREHLSLLSAEHAEVRCADAFNLLGQPHRTFDVVFLDPPFGRSWLPELCTLLEKNGWLNEEARIYLEWKSGTDLAGLPENWELRRERRAGQVAYGLAVRQA